MALRNSTTNDANLIDLTALPPDDPADRMRRIYGFLSGSVEVIIVEGVAAIMLERASQEAARGKY